MLVLLLGLHERNHNQTRSPLFLTVYPVGPASTLIKHVNLISNQLYGLNLLLKAVALYALIFVHRRSV